MKFRDAIGMAISALGRHKLRTALTALGVASGTLALAGSLSIGQGVQQAIESAWRRQDQLRTIDLFPGWRPETATSPPPPIEVPGAMSEERRERLRAALTERWHRDQSTGFAAPLDRETIDWIAGLDHVEAVVPAVNLYGWMLYDSGNPDSGNAAASATGASSGTDDASNRGLPAVRGQTVAAGFPEEYAARLVAGKPLADDDDSHAIVSELVAYQWGVLDEADVPGILGRKLRIEIRSAVESPNVLTRLFGNSTASSREDERLLARLLHALPNSLDKFDFSEADRESLKKLLSVESRPKPTTDNVVAEEYVIKGVVRLTSADERQQSEQMFRMRDSSVLYADALLPQRTAEKFFERSPAGADGYYRAWVRVDREENVKQVLAAVREHKVEARAPIDFIEREQFQYAIIFHAMSCVAAVALAVAAIGIANTMLMSVLERTREIGILKALGARDRDISRMFVFEGAAVGLVGGGLGLAAARLAAIPGDESLRAMVLERFKVELTDSLFVFPPWIAVGSVAFATLATTLAAFHPARRAARIDPITALRHE